MLFPLPTVLLYLLLLLIITIASTSTPHTPPSSLPTPPNPHLTASEEEPLTEEPLTEEPLEEPLTIQKYCSILLCTCELNSHLPPHNTIYTTLPLPSKDSSEIESKVELYGPPLEPFVTRILNLLNIPPPTTTSPITTSSILSRSLSLIDLSRTRSASYTNLLQARTSTSYKSVSTSSIHSIGHQGLVRSYVPVPPRYEDYKQQVPFVMYDTVHRIVVGTIAAGIKKAMEEITTGEEGDYIVGEDGMEGILGDEGEVRRLRDFILQYAEWDGGGG